MALGNCRLRFSLTVVASDEHIGVQMEPDNGYAHSTLPPEDHPAVTDAALALSALRNEAGELAGRLEAVTADEEFWERMHDVSEALLALDPDQRVKAMELFGQKLSARTTPYVAELNPLTAARYRDARLIVEHPTALDLRGLRRQLRKRQRDLRAGSMSGNEAGLREAVLRSRELVDSLEKAPSMPAGFGSSQQDKIGATRDTAIVALAALAKAVRCNRPLSRTLALRQAWVFGIAAVVVGAGEVFALQADKFDSPNRTIALAYFIVVAVGPGLVIFEAHRPENRTIWIPRWSIIRSCALAIIAGLYFLWFALRSADGAPLVAWSSGFLIALSVATVIATDDRRLFSNANIAGILASVLAASSLITFLYQEQYMPRVAVPLVVTTASLEARPAIGGFDSDPHRLVLEATLTVKNEGSVSVHIMGALYRVEGDLIDGTKDVARVTPSDLASGFDLLNGSSARFSAPAGARLAGANVTAAVLIQADELIPSNVFMVPGESWSTSFEVIIDPMVISSVRLSTDIVAARKTHLALKEPEACTSSGSSPYGAGTMPEILEYKTEGADPTPYFCISQRLADRTFVDSEVNSADRIYTYIVMGDGVFGRPTPVPSLFVSPDDLRREYHAGLTEEVNRVYSLVEFLNYWEWAH
jgi:hypothetical protein